MLGLKLPTDPRWVNLAEISIEDILTDHAYCEQKAASNGISMIQKYPEYERVVEELVPLVSEEWGHFKLVLEQLSKRNLKLGQQRRDEYVNALLGFMHKGGTRLIQITERLLFSALIEARSCERFKLLSQNVDDAELRSFYKNLMVSEAGHYKMFLDLACELYGKDKALARWEEYLEFEAGVMKELEVRGDRMH